MSKINALVALAIATLALPAMAGSWPNLPARKASTTAAGTWVAIPPQSAQAAPVSNDGFAYIGGDGGWELVQHNYVLSNGRLVHSDECDHAVRAPAVAAPASNAGFVNAGGGDGGWELARHKYVSINGRYAHSNECDHTVRARVWRGPTAAEVEDARIRYPG